ncbi:MAG: hypothetical protein WBF90_32225 [Rivularia sp. (in: cyanobacteria)]
MKPSPNKDKSLSTEAKVAIITGVFSIIVAVIAQIIPTPPTPPPTPPTPPTPPPIDNEVVANATLAYWNKWKDMRKNYAVAVEPLITKYTVDNSMALSSLNTQLADNLRQTSAVNVDPELAQIAANAIILYKNVARSYREQANILYTWNTFIQKRDSDVAAGVAIFVFLFNENDRFAIPRALAEEANQIKNQWNNNSLQINKNNQDIQVMVNERNRLKINLESRYSITFPE